MSLKRRDFITLIGGRGDVAARRACAASGDAGDWVTPLRIA